MGKGVDELKVAKSDTEVTRCRQNCSESIFSATYSCSSVSEKNLEVEQWPTIETPTTGYLKCRIIFSVLST